jgi:hypothetical protein
VLADLTTHRAECSSNARPDLYRASREHARVGGADACAVAVQACPAGTGPRGCAVSSAILYLAIVAIWAVVLVPRWLRPRAVQPELAEQPGEPQPVAAEPAEPAPAEDTGQHDWADPGPAWAAGEEGPGEPEDPPLLSPTEERASIVQARRRMLGTLVALAAGAVGLAATGITGFWVVIPPAVLLAGFVVLLREAAHADAKRDRRATRLRDVAVSPLAGQEPASFLDDGEADQYQVPATATAWAAGPPPGADVIDISGRVSDQVYDQYADAVERAVGD